MDLLGFRDCLKYLHLLEPVIQGFFVGIKIDIQVVFYYAAALILHLSLIHISLKLHYYGNRLSEAVLNGVPMELLDVLDEGGEPSGLVRERSMVHERGDYHRTSHVWVVREKPDGSPEAVSYTHLDVYKRQA